MPLSAPDDLKDKLRRLRPNIFATCYRMDINAKGYWEDRDAKKQQESQGTNSDDQGEKKQPETPSYEKRRTRPKAAIARSILQKQSKVVEETSNESPKKNKDLRLNHKTL